jgi:hypothetical protein
MSPQFPSTVWPFLVWSLLGTGLCLLTRTMLPEVAGHIVIEVVSENTLPAGWTAEFKG